MRYIRWLSTSVDSSPIRARRIIKILVFLGLFIALFWIIPVDRVVQALLTANLFLFFLGVVLGLLASLLTSFQMKPLLYNQDIKRGIGQIFAVNLAVKFYLFFTPTTLIASGIRWYRFSKPEGKFTEAFVALAYFRLFETFLTLAMGSGFLLLSTQRAIQVNGTWVVLLIVGIILIWLLITRFSLRIYQWIRMRSARFLNKPFLKWSLQKLEKLLDAASAFALMPAKELVGVMVSGILSALAVIASGVVFAKSLGIAIGLLEMGWIQAVISLASQLPFTMAEGLGVREITLVALLGIFDVSAERALALSLLIFIRSIIIALLGGVIEALNLLRIKRLARTNPIP